MDANSLIELITEVLNSIFSNLFSSIDNNLFLILDNLAFVNTDIINSTYIEDIIGNNLSSGILVVANSLVVGFVLYYAVSYLFSYISLSHIQNPVIFILRLILILIFMNSSFFICEKVLSLNFNISLAIRQIGEDLLNKDISFSSLITQLNSSIYINSNINIFSVDGMAKGFISFGLFNLVFSYALRYVMIKVFVLICPFAILSLISSKTTWFFSSWLKSFLALLFIQILVSIILLIIFTFNFESQDIMSKIMYIGAVYALIKSNSFIKEIMGGISINVENNLNNFKYLFKK